MYVYIFIHLYIYLYTYYIYPYVDLQKCICIHCYTYIHVHTSPRLWSSLTPFPVPPFATSPHQSPPSHPNQIRQISPYSYDNYNDVYSRLQREGVTKSNPTHKCTPAKSIIKRVNIPIRIPSIN
jgi:hypothetical protein